MCLHFSNSSTAVTGLWKSCPGVEPSMSVRADPWATNTLTPFRFNAMGFGAMWMCGFAYSSGA